MLLYPFNLKDRRFIVFFSIFFASIIFRGKTFSTNFRASCILGSKLELFEQGSSVGFLGGGMGGRDDTV